ncbi:hypothetical protein BofuT4_uP144940.1 [Botrytis cinerea T4]|uniref:Uncharacterized protein n=1 Tax=Botryotinia fuckeliana (strain T4) TaxID=999810 RepID=G2YYI8_BOTF4|nr:hypothetical protein BofuT4_uP144940.1 [Botrytis cinerea T4]
MSISREWNASKGCILNTLEARFDLALICRFLPSDKSAQHYRMLSNLSAHHRAHYRARQRAHEHTSTPLSGQDIGI